jgi:type I restriction-modification system DNA methylase subunit
LISAILISLQDKPFLSSYQEYTSNKDLIESLIEASKRVLKNNKLEEKKTGVIIDEYSKFKNNVSFNSQTFYNKKTKKDEVNTILKDFIILINENILPYINNSEFDVLGKFYTQFIRYAGSDKKTGLVLTPTHITDLFCDIADLSTDDIVFDECCGTAGFLVSAMNYMLKKAGSNIDKKKKIKSSQLLGIEARSDMFSHACSNMMMRGDGKSHILYGDCFTEANKNIIKSNKPTKAFLNPPYQDGNAAEQLEFIENALSCLVKDGICIAICQMSTTVSSANDVIAVRERLMNNHTLEATFSMPTDLFHPVGVNTSILIFKAHNPHSKGKKTFFGYFKDDGFVKTKNQGRIDRNDKWKEIKKRWLSTYVNKESIVGLSVMQQVTKDDEWCAEAYMETDYSQLNKDDFIKIIHEYISFLFSHSFINNASNKPHNNKQVSLKDRNWKWIDLIDYFNMNAGKYYPKDSYSDGGIPLVTSSENNNGVMAFTDLKSKYKNCLTIGKVGCSVYYQERGFVASSDVTILKPKFSMNSFHAMFLVSLIKQEGYKWSYGRQIRLNDSERLKIKLPVTKKGNPDWEFMEYYIKSLPYSGNLKNEDKKQLPSSFFKLLDKSVQPSEE